MDTVFYQTSFAEQPVPWYNVCRNNLSPGQREKLRLQASLLTSYLSFGTEPPSKPRLNAIAAITKSVENIHAQCFQPGYSYEGKVELTLSIIQTELPPAGKKYEKGYMEAIWLISRTLGKGYALIVACALEKRQSLDRATCIHIFSYLGSGKKSLQDCASLCESILEGGSQNALAVTQDMTSDQDVSPAFHSITSLDYLENDYWQKFSLHAKRFFNFLCSLKCDDLPEILLLRMARPTETWGSDGCIQFMNPPCIDPIVHDIITGKAFDYILLFLSVQLIRRRSGGFGRCVFTIPSHIQKRFGKCDLQSTVTDWSRLVLICHAFPGRSEETWFIDQGRILLPQLRHAFDSCPDVKDRINQDSIHGYKVVLALILSTKLPGLEWKLKAINVVEEILAGSSAFGQSSTDYFQGLLRLRKMEISARVQNVHFDNIRDIPVARDPRLRSVCGMRIRFLAQKLVMEDIPRLDEAYRLVDTSIRRRSPSPSPMERHELNLQQFMRCKILRWQGAFFEAAQGLHCLFNIFGDNFDDTGCNFWSHYVGSLCELRQFSAAERWSRHAIESFKELQTQGILSERQKRYRLLRLSLAETLLWRNVVDHGRGLYLNHDLSCEMNEALSIYDDLDSEYRELEKRDWASRLEHLRVTLGRAIIAHFSVDIPSATHLWCELEVSVQYCRKNHQVTGFLEMIIDYCRCDLATRVGKYREAREVLTRAKDSFKSMGREYWWTCIGTVFLDLLDSDLLENTSISRSPASCPLVLN